MASGLILFLKFITRR